MGFFTIIPLALASMTGGLLYNWDAISPWIFVFAATALSLLLALFFIRDSKNAEV